METCTVVLTFESVVLTFESTCTVVLTFESVDEIPWYDYSNEISFTVLSHGTICLAGFEKLKIVIFLEFLLWSLLRVKGLITVFITYLL